MTRVVRSAMFQSVPTSRLLLRRRTLIVAALLGVVGPLAAFRAPQDAAKPAAPPAPTAPPAAPPAKEFILMSTSKGDIVLELARDKAPITVENFVEYVDKQYYDGTIFHRVIPGFMIQGGGFTADMKAKAPRPPIKNEWTNGLRNQRGTIAMARLAQPDTASSQFFINVRDNPSLDGDAAMGSPGYAVFGKVIGGMEVVDAIKAVPTKRVGPHEAVPVEAVIIQKVTRISEEDARKRAEAAKSDAPATPPATPPAAPPAAPPAGK